MTASCLMSMFWPMVRFENVGMRYGAGPEVLRDVTFLLEPGSFTFLTGLSGAGKTTLLKLIFCAEKATRGQVLVGGRNIARIRESAVPYLRRNIGVVFQDFKLLPRRSVLDNVAFTLDVLGVPRAEARDRVMKMLKLVGLEHKADQLPLRLSGGEQQRVVIARALVNDPTILLADEPTGNLDPLLTVEIMDLLCEVNVRGTTVLVATHDTTLIERYQKRTIRIEHGQVVSDEDGVKAARRMVAG